MMYTNGNQMLRSHITGHIPRQIQPIQPNLPSNSAHQRPASYVNRQGKIRFATSLSEGPAIPDPNTIPHSQRMRWGAPTWTLFHVMAAQVPPALFPQMRVGMLDIITAICGNLPCPDCANHATDYLRKINYDLIRTPDHLRAMLFEFHNSVNMRKGVPPYPWELMSVYARMDIRETVYKFMHFFENKHTNNSRMNPHSFARSLQSQRIKDWFYSNGNVFRPI